MEVDTKLSSIDRQKKDKSSSSSTSSSSSSSSESSTATIKGSVNGGDNTGTSSSNSRTRKQILQDLSNFISKGYQCNRKEQLQSGFIAKSIQMDICSEVEWYKGKKIKFTWFYFVRRFIFILLFVCYSPHLYTITLAVIYLYILSL